MYITLPTPRLPRQVCDLPLCKVLVCDDAQYPCWLVLVPRVNRVREVTELREEQQEQLWREVAAASRVVQVRRARCLFFCCRCFIAFQVFRTQQRARHIYGVQGRRACSGAGWAAVGVDSGPASPHARLGAAAPRRRRRAARPALLRSILC